MALKAQAAIELAAPTARHLHAQAAIECTSLRSCTAGSLKGQAAMEYLVTYGWALLALLLVVAFLLSSGAFSPNSYSTQECSFQPDLPCTSFILYKPDSAKSTLQFTVANGFGFPIRVTSVNYTATNLGGDGRQTYGGILVAPLDLASGAKTNFTQNFAGENQPSDRTFKTIYVAISYLNCRDSTACTGPYTTTGRISALVEPKQ